MANLIAQADMDDVTHECWLPVVGFEGYYEVSDLGRVRSLTRQTARRKVTGRILSPGLGARGYLVVVLCRDGARTTCQVHRLVAAAFHGPCPRGEEVRHDDGVKTNNVASNLIYGTHIENMEDMRRHGTNHNAAKEYCDSGHEFTPENTRIRPDGARDCRACARLNAFRRRQEKRAVHPRAVEPRDCEVCGVSFTPRRSAVRFCSRACRDKAPRQPALSVPCACCGELFMPIREGHIYCSKQCSNRSRQH